MALIWSVIPLYNIFNFATCPIEPLVEDGKSMTMPQLLKTKAFWIFIILMICAGSSEIAMGQWHPPMLNQHYMFPKQLEIWLDPADLQCAWESVDFFMESSVKKLI